MRGENVILAVPSKGRLMEPTRALFAEGGLEIRKNGSSRGYRGTLDGIDGVEVAFLSASEIAEQLRLGHVHFGVTGEDLIRESIAEPETELEFIQPLGFGHADVVVAVPDCWIDVNRMSDLQDAAAIFHHVHERRLRVATKYVNMTRRFFDGKGVSAYRIVESLGATEGAPTAGSAEIIVDITSTGATLTANHLRVLEDGIMLRSQATLFASRRISSPSAVKDARAAIISSLNSAKAG